MYINNWPKKTTAAWNHLKLLFNKRNTDLVQFASTIVKFMFSGKKNSQICHKFLELMSKCILFIFVYVYGKGKLPWQDSDYFKLGEF